MSARGGFTLLELLVAMSLLGIVLAILSGGLQLAVSSLRSGEARAAALERNRGSMRIIMAQLESFLPLTASEDNGSRSFQFRGGSDTLRLASGYSAWGGPRGAVLVEYRSETKGNGRLRLLARESPASIQGAESDMPQGGAESVKEAGPQGRQYMLFDDLAALKFEYFRREPGEEKGEWVEQWQETTSVPEKVRLSVSMGRDSYSFVVPIRTRETPDLGSGRGGLPKP